jgi:hypothetical protein
VTENVPFTALAFPAKGTAPMSACAQPAGRLAGALTVTDTVLDVAVAPALGAPFAGVVTETETALDVVVAPASSVATAVRLKLPAGTLLQVSV